jgi:hypothetical protein
MGIEAAAPYAVLRVDRRKAKAMAAISAASAHQMRQRDTPNADPEGPPPLVLHLADGKTPYQAASKLLDGAERRNKDTVLCREVVLSAGPSFFRPGREHLGGIFDPPKLKAWVAASLAWARRQWPDQLASAVLHLDEQTPHLHLLVVPRVKQGDSGWKLNSKALFDRQRLTEMQTTYAKALEHLGIRRGEPGSDARHAEVKQFYGIASKPAVSRPVPPKKPAPPKHDEGSMSNMLRPLAKIVGLDQSDPRADYDAAMAAWRSEVAVFRKHETEAWKALAAAAAMGPLRLRGRSSNDANKTASRAPSIGPGPQPRGPR